jgi:hypothetical protein
MEQTISLSEVTGWAADLAVLPARSVGDRTLRGWQAFCGERRCGAVWTAQEGRPHEHPV